MKRIDEHRPLNSDRVFQLSLPESWKDKPKPAKFRVIGMDDWSRRLLKSEKTGRVYVVG